MGARRQLCDTWCGGSIITSTSSSSLISSSSITTSSSATIGSSKCSTVRSDPIQLSECSGGMHQIQRCDRVPEGVKPVEWLEQLVQYIVG